MALTTPQFPSHDHIVSLCENPCASSAYYMQLSSFVCCGPNALFIVGHRELPSHILRIIKRILRNVAVLFTLQVPLPYKSRLYYDNLLRQCADKPSPGLSLYQLGPCEDTCCCQEPLIVCCRLRHLRRSHNCVLGNPTIWVLRHGCS